MAHKKQHDASAARRAKRFLAAELEDETELFFNAVSLQQQGQLDQATSLYCKILALNPHHFEALSRLGSICLQRGNLTEALRLLGLSLQINPRQAVAWSNQGSALKGLKRLDEALASYEQALALDPSNLDAFMSRAGLLASANRGIKTA